MTFYEKFCELCKYHGVSPTRAATDIGLARSAVTRWKKYPYTKPTSDTIQRFAVYFGVSARDLFDFATASLDSDDELDELLDMLRTRPECRILLSTAKGATKSQVEANIRVIEAIRGVTDAD